jgi:hypothetical protein
MRLDTWQRQISPVNMRKGLIFGCLLILLLGGTTPAGAR